MLLNFYLTDNLQVGKEILNGALGDSGGVKYLSNFRDIVFDPPDANDHSALTRYNRRILAYRALLFKAGLQAPNNLRPNTRNLFNSELLAALNKDAQKGDNKASADYGACATILSKQTPTWAELTQAFEILRKYIADNTSGWVRSILTMSRSTVPARGQTTT
jgi:hypothetical protein